MMHIASAYMNLSRGLWVKERLDSVPQHSKARTRIDNEHPVQGLQWRQNMFQHHVKLK